MSKNEACNLRCEMAQYCQNVRELLVPTSLECDLILSDEFRGRIEAQLEELGMRNAEATEAVDGLRTAADESIARKHRTRRVANRFLQAAAVECPGKRESRHGLLGTVTVKECGMLDTPEYKAAQDMRLNTAYAPEIQP